MTDVPQPEKPPQQAQQMGGGGRPGQGSERPQQTDRTRDGQAARSGDSNREGRSAEDAREHPERGRDKAGTTDASNRGKTSDKGDKTADLDEKKRVAFPSDGIGYEHGKAVARDDQLQHLHATFDSPMQAVREGRAKVFIEAKASRDGTSEQNRALTDQRAANARDLLIKEFGLKPDQIRSISLGEGDAISRGAPDGRDNANDRIATISIVSDERVASDRTTGRDGPASRENAVKDLNKAVPDGSQPDNIKEFKERGKLAWDTTKDLVEKGTSANALDKIKAAAKIYELAGRLWADNVKHAHERFDISTGVIPAYLGEVERQLLGHAVTRPEIERTPALYTSDSQAQRGRESADLGTAMARDAMKGLSAETRAYLTKEFLGNPNEIRKAIRFDLYRRLSH